MHLKRQIKAIMEELLLTPVLYRTIKIYTLIVEIVVVFV